MGGDLASFLRDESEKAKKLRVTSMKSFLDSLAGMAEVYVSFMIALPLVLVVMLSVMSFLGGGVNACWHGSSNSFVAYDLHSYTCWCRNNVANGRFNDASEVIKLGKVTIKNKAINFGAFDTCSCCSCSQLLLLYHSQL